MLSISSQLRIHEKRERGKKSHTHTHTHTHCGQHQKRTNAQAVWLATDKVKTNQKKFFLTDGNFQAFISQKKMRTRHKLMYMSSFGIFGIFWNISIVDFPSCSLLKYLANAIGERIWGCSATQGTGSCCIEFHFNPSTDLY